ncbi:activator of s-phase kinase-related [Anaeramoeba flamelloides]|uniref:Activator of s-phase kinase-related n=1 Tax=Anaeramoeba flamelloides TaxID=1746091 RepID=A0AAV7ZSL6_9EUKA|nr:activator of s-phase kinase-related [Anaeramoeba flamelloides]KAJ6238066.1 activator of s-phase kinase-related [Anaeramoeba flamelloides]
MMKKNVNKHDLMEHSKQYNKRLIRIQEYFKYPFIMIEETSFLFKSAIKEFKKNRVPSSRSLIKKRSKLLNPNYSLKMLNQKKKQKKPKRKKTLKGGGHCRICEKKYTDLDMHIQTQLHRNFAQDDNNFYEVDILFLQIEREQNGFSDESDLGSNSSLEYTISNSESGCSSGLD